MECLSLLDGVNVAPLQVLGNHGIESLFIGHIADDAGDGFEGQKRTGTIATLAADNLVLYARRGAIPIDNDFVNRPDGDGLEQPLPGDIVGQFAERFFLNGLSRVEH